MKIFPCVIGLGYVGLPIFLRLQRKFKTVGFDNNRSRILELNKTIDRNKEFKRKELLLKNKSVVTCSLEEIKNCNFYIPRKHFQEIGRPLGVKFYDGDFLELVDDLEDIVAMHLVASKSDIVLLAGFDLSIQNTPQDRFAQHRLKNRLGLMRSAFVNNPEIQWVLVDHPKEVDKAFSDLSNLTCDVMKNVLNLLK